MHPERWQQISRLSHAALDHHPGKRAEFLDQECGEDNELRREVESLLARDPSAQHVLETPALEVAARMVRSVSAAPAVESQVGSYRIESLIGQGGMGTVFRARDTRLNRSVAIKFISDDLADTAARRRFQREAQMASALNHPHIVAVHDVGDFNSRQYIVTEFIDGGTLDDWARRTAPTWERIVGSVSRRIRDLQVHQRGTQRLTVGIERQRPGDPPTERPRHDEVQRAELRQFVAHDVSQHDAVKELSNPHRGDLSLKVGVIATIVRDHGNVAGVPLVTGAPVCDLSELHQTVS